MKNWEQNLSRGITALGTLAYAGVFATAWSRGYKGYNLGSAAVLISPVVFFPLIWKRSPGILFKRPATVSIHLLFNPTIAQGLVSVCGLPERRFSGILAKRLSIYNISMLYQVMGSGQIDTFRMQCCSVMQCIVRSGIQAYVPYLNEWGWGSHIALNMMNMMVFCAATSLSSAIQREPIQWEQMKHYTVNSILTSVAYESLGVLVDKAFSPFNYPISNSIIRCIFQKVVSSLEQSYIKPQVEYYL